MASKYRITTLGCRVNFAETREIESILQSRGLQAAKPDAIADLEIIHTCSVTNQAAAKSRQAIRRAGRRQIREDPAGTGIGLTVDADHGTPGDSVALHDGRAREVWVTGCYAGTNTEQASMLVGQADRVIAHNPDMLDKSGRSLVERLAEKLDHWLAQSDRQALDRTSERRQRTSIRSPYMDSCTGEAKIEGGPPDSIIHPLPVITPGSTAGQHVRAELKIQDGCDACCTFCILPGIRSTLRSKRISDAVAEARRLVDLGHREIVLSGIFIGAYGHETALRRRQRVPEAEPLADLLDAVASVDGLERLRISSMEPGDVTETLLDAMVANAPVVVPHLHLPLQSGSDTILKRMNRQYTTDDYRTMILRVHESLTPARTGLADLPPAITTDIICGFPGESDADFQQTVDLVEEAGFLHLHVFPFSPRPGTAAARWTDQFVATDVARERVRYLIDLENEPEDGLSIRYRRRLLGQTVRVILEQPSRDDPESMTGRCDHYAAISVKTRRERGTLVMVRITEVQSSITLGRIERQPLRVLAQEPLSGTPFAP